MKVKILFFLTVFALTSCKQDQKNEIENHSRISTSLSYHSSKGKLMVQSGKFQYQINEKKLPLKRTVFLNSSLLGYAAELGAESQIIGVASPEYIFSNKMQTLVQSGNISTVGNEQKYDLEKIISLRPDAVFSNYVPSFENTYDLLRKNGIEVIFLDEYTEQKPLEKSAYLKLFGKLFGKEKLAEKRFSEIESSYKQLKTLAANAHQKPTVLANEMYGDIWYLPGGETFTAHYIADAGGRYFLQNNLETKAVTMNFEEVYAKAGNVNIWINAGNHHSKQEMLTINPLYAKLNAFTKGKIYAVTQKEVRKANDFFESGVVRADLVLKDYIKIFHPDLLPYHQLYYMKEVQ